MSDLHPQPEPVFRIRNLNFYYGTHQALFDNNLDIAENCVTAIIGPPGCGKSTHIRVYNRIYELYADQRAEGQIYLDGKNILDPSYDLMDLRNAGGIPAVMNELAPLLDLNQLSVKLTELLDALG